ncbi:MAG: LuxR C-terminal-related transcriptional regulator [Pseudomonadota bacterium]
MNSEFLKNVPFLASSVIVQIFCSMFFLVNFVISISGAGPSQIEWREMSGLEISAGIGLFIGSVASLRLMYLALKANMESEQVVKKTQGEFEDVVIERLNSWNLTKAEREVAWFTIKGLDIKHIAELRGASVGTVKVQLVSIYRKSGTDNRAQFIASLIDDLLVDRPLLSVPD